MGTLVTDKSITESGVSERGGEVRSEKVQFQYNQRPVTFSDLEPVSSPGKFSGPESCLIFAVFAPDSGRKFQQF